MYCIALHYITILCTILYYTKLYYSTVHYIILHYITVQYSTLHYSTLHCIILHYITLHYMTVQSALERWCGDGVAAWRIRTVSLSRACVTTLLDGSVPRTKASSHCTLPLAEGRGGAASVRAAVPRWRAWCVTAQPPPRAPACPPLMTHPPGPPDDTPLRPSPRP